MQFVVKAFAAIGPCGWISIADKRGVRSLATRERAQIFANRSAAESVISKMPVELVAAGIKFTVEPADTEAQIEVMDPVLRRSPKDG
jgi:hypothetical protein